MFSIYHKPTCPVKVSINRSCNCGAINYVWGDYYKKPTPVEDLKNVNYNKLGIKDSITPSSILDEAEFIVNGERKADYGPSESFGKIARICKEAFNIELSAKDVVKVLMSVKMCRESFNHKRDNLVDLCGYAELLNRLEEE